MSVVKPVAPRPPFGGGAFEGCVRTFPGERG